MNLNNLGIMILVALGVGVIVVTLATTLYDLFHPNGLRKLIKRYEELGRHGNR